MSTELSNLQTISQTLDSDAFSPKIESSLDGTGIALSWPLVNAAASLLTEVIDTVEPLPLPEDATPPPEREFISLPQR